MPRPKTRRHLRVVPDTAAEAPGSPEALHARARAGDVEAMLVLGRAFVRGEGGDRSLERGFYWFHRAAMLGYTPAMVSLAQCLLRGVGEERRPRVARLWLERATEDGSRPAQELLRRLSEPAARPEETS